MADKFTEEVVRFDVLIARTRRGIISRGMIFTGSADGTALLRGLRSRADTAGWVTVALDGKSDSRKTLRAALSPTPFNANSTATEADLQELTEDISAPLIENQTALGVFIDNMQDLDKPFLAELLSVQHIAGQRGWPFYIVGAGLPDLTAVLGEIRPYAERLFDYRKIEPLKNS